MARSKVAYRKRKQNRLSMIMVTMVVVLIMIVVAVRSVELQKKIDAKVQEEVQLDTKIAAEEERAEQIEEFGKEVQTKGYIEKMAREKLGLVYEGEVMFKEEK